MKPIAATVVSLLLTVGPFYCQGFSSTPVTTTASTKTEGTRGANTPHRPIEESFSVPLVTERPEPKTFSATLNQLWNDPRPVTSLIGDALSKNEGSSNGDGDSDDGKIPYCLLSDEFLIDSKHKFRISLFPQGRFAAALSSSSSQQANGPAAAYLRYVPNQYGDEVDIGWKLRLVDTRTNESMPIMTSGGLPRSNTTWSAAMTFCADNEDIESCGRVADWGSSSWYAEQVCDAVRSGCIEARGEIMVYDSRTGESSFSFPPKGAIKAVIRAGTEAGRAGQVIIDNDENENRPGNKIEERSFRVGEVIVPMANNQTQNILEESFVNAGTDYRIMTMASKDGTPIFSTNDVPAEERDHVRLALRPCGWKLLQQQLWRKTVEWPVEVDAGLLSTSALSRFNIATAFPRVASTFQRDKTAVLLGVALALLPLPGALIGRNFVSLYAIPSASMDPTLMKGDVLLVEKFPKAFDRTSRGDIVLFRPPSALTDIAGSINSNSLFVKRVVGLPGDTNIVLNPETKEATLNGGQPAVGPNRNLCDDEPLRLIDWFLEQGKGKNIDELGENDVYVVGDCKDVSIDSRVFGVLPKQNIEGKPIGRIWPPSRVTFRKL